MHTFILAVGIVRDGETFTKNGQEKQDVVRFMGVKGGEPVICDKHIAAGTLSLIAFKAMVNGLQPGDFK